MEEIRKTGEAQRADRNSAIELLRIISMLMIVGCHFATHGGFSFDSQEISVQRLWWNLIEMGGNFGVDVFVLISGFFLIENRSMKADARKVLKLWGQIFFYSIGLFFFAFLIGKGTSSPTSVIMAFFPVTFSRWWFASTYFVMYLLHPYLNRLLYTFDKRQYRKFLLGFFLIWSFIPTFWSIIPTVLNSFSPFQSDALIQFVLLYSIAGYIKLYVGKPTLNSRRWFLIWLGFSAISYLGCVSFLVVGKKYPVYEAFSLYLYNRNSVLTLLRAISFFMAFSSLKIRYNRWINVISSASFGVYLLHDSDLLREYFWVDVFHNASYQNSPLLIPYSLLAVVLVYSLCTVIDLARIGLFEKPFLGFADAYWEKWTDRMRKLRDRIDRILF